MSLKENALENLNLITLIQARRQDGATITMDKNKIGNKDRNEKPSFLRAVILCIYHMLSSVTES
jgi:hypothetical protein